MLVADCAHWRWLRPAGREIERRRAAASASTADHAGCDHLRHLGIDAVVNGRPVRVVALYAEAPDYRPTGSPARDGYEGIAAWTMPRARRVVYLRAYEDTGDVRATVTRRSACSRSSRRWSRATASSSTSSTPRGGRTAGAEQPQEHVVLGRAQPLGARRRRARASARAISALAEELRGPSGSRGQRGWRAKSMRGADRRIGHRDSRSAARAARAPARRAVANACGSSPRAPQSCSCRSAPAPPTRRRGARASIVRAAAGTRGAPDRPRRSPVPRRSRPS